MKMILITALKVQYVVPCDTIVSIRSFKNDAGKITRIDVVTYYEILNITLKASLDEGLADVYFSLLSYLRNDSKDWHRVDVSAYSLNREVRC